jgi:hypothetical protein
VRPFSALGFLLLVGLLGQASAADSRFPPREIRAAAAGCWQVGRGITLTLDDFGKHSLTATTRFPKDQRQKGTPAVVSELASWSQERGLFEVQCRPRSQHGSFCLVGPTKNGLQVRVYAIRYGHPGVGNLVDTFIAARCAVQGTGESG